MTVFTNNLKRIFKNKLQFSMIILLPTFFLVIITLSINSLGDTKNAVQIGIVDMDKTRFTAIIANNLANKAKIKLVQQNKIQEELINSKVNYIIEIEKGFTEGIIKGERREVKGYYLKDSIKSLPVQKYMESFIGSSVKIAKASGGDEKKFYRGMKLYEDAGVQMDYKVTSEIDRYKAYESLGKFVMFMLYTSVVYTTMTLIDKENKTFYRTITSPISVKSYMFQNILSFLMVSFIQVTVIFIALKTFTGVYLGESVLNMYILFLAISIVCVSLGVAVSSVSKNLMQAIFTGLFIAFPMSFLGGCWWPNEMATSLMRTLGKFTPVYWGMEGVSKLINESNLYSVKGEILIMLLFAVVFFFLGTWRNEDITR